MTDPEPEPGPKPAPSRPRPAKPKAAVKAKPDKRQSAASAPDAIRLQPTEQQLKSTDFMNTFWDLASLEPEKRIDASARLLSVLATR